MGSRTEGRSVLTELVEKTADVVPSQGQWQVYFLGFARGWLDRRQPRVRRGSHERPPDRQELAGARHAAAGFDAS